MEFYWSSHHNAYVYNFRTAFIVYLIAFLVCLLLVAFLPLFVEETIQLPIPCSALPYSTDGPKLFWLTYFLHCYEGIIGILVQMGVGNLFIGFMLLVKHRQEIVKHRLRNLGKSKNPDFNCLRQKVIYENEILKQIFCDHERIHKYLK